MKISQECKKRIEKLWLNLNVLKILNVIKPGLRIFLPLPSARLYRQRIKEINSFEE